MFSKRAADPIAKDKEIKSDDIPYINLSSYPEKAEREKEFKQLIMNEIERKDKAFMINGVTMKINVDEYILKHIKGGYNKRGCFHKRSYA